MRILLIGINFYPDLTGVGKYTAEMAAYLNGEGHFVHVVTAPPYYPYWKVQLGYSGWRYKHEVWEGIQVFRAPLWVPDKPTGIKRLLHLISFALTSIPLLLGHIAWRPELVICIAPAFFCAPFAWLTARLSGAKSWLHIQDFELDAATSLGMLPANHFLTKWAACGERWMLGHFDRVSTISKSMMDCLYQKGVKPEHARFFPNWIDTNLIFPLSDPQDSLRNALEIPEDKIVVFYSGNMGFKQGLECMVEAARELQKHTDILFVLCGEGAAREYLEKAAADLTNVKFFRLQSIEKLNRLLNIADIHILPMKSDVADLVMPSKILGMLASGKVILSNADPGTEIGDVVGKVGVRVPHDDIPAMCEAILRLANSSDERSCLGERGRTFVCENWSKDLVLPRFRMDLLNLMNEVFIKSKVELISNDAAPGIKSKF